MRLIDADKFIEDLGLDKENTREDNIGEIITLEDFGRQETAYDVRDVIQRLQLELELEKRDRIFYAKEGDKLKAYEFLGREEGIETAIEIVKSGGVSDE